MHDSSLTKLDRSGRRTVCVLMRDWIRRWANSSIGPSPFGDHNTRHVHSRRPRSFAESCLSSVSSTSSDVVSTSMSSLPVALELSRWRRDVVAVISLKYGPWSCVQTVQWLSALRTRLLKGLETVGGGACVRGAWCVRVAPRRSPFPKDPGCSARRSSVPLGWRPQASATSGARPRWAAGCIRSTRSRGAVPVPGRGAAVAVQSLPHHRHQ